MTYLHADTIAALAKKKLPAASQKLIQPFLRSYYTFVGDDDLSECTAESLFATAKEHFALLQKYNGKKVLINVYNPSIKKHGYSP